MQGMQACTPLDGESGTGRVAIGAKGSHCKNGVTREVCASVGPVTEKVEAGNAEP
ncbi:MAG TPA: hypothetical protein PK297_14420 [Spirochaetota bacterium]|nr:hypothetical protein [Spirochaetota bacterium]